ncbi:MAG: hypothetical protein JHC30_06275 [Caldisericum sp.]|jgi:hypothetical protein|nr:hypothetical protein [Caldisericum sp.]
MAEPVIIFRVSKWFLERINDYCKEEQLSYTELLNRAIVHLCRKYLGEDYAERKNSRRKNRV